MMIKKAFGLGVAAASGAQAFWRMECRGRLDVARIDPLASPGRAALHAHALHGSSGLSDTSDWSDLRAGNCSSCLVTEDKSAYWTPAMYFQDEDTGEFELVEQVGGMLAYYLLRGDNITAFPPGFAMISGDNDRRNYTAGDMYAPDPDQSHWVELGESTQDRLAQRALGFNCLNDQRDAEGTLYRHYMPDKDYLVNNCLSGLRAELAFPMCWNGNDMDSGNHKDHVAFASLVLNGDCPSTHPYRIPLLLYETIWNVLAYKDRTGRFMWSNGDTTGLGYHGDFVAGWEAAYLQDAVDTCRNESGMLTDCPVFTPNMQSATEAEQCKMPSLPDYIANENCTGPIETLPGDPSVPADSGYATHTAELSYSPGATPVSSGVYLPGQVFAEHSTTVTPAEPTTPAETPTPIIEISIPLPIAPETTVAPEIPTTTWSSMAAPTTDAANMLDATAEDGRIFSTEWATRSGVVEEILWELEIVSVTKTVDCITTVTTSVTTTVVPTPVKRRRGLGHPHHLYGHMH